MKYIRYLASILCLATANTLAANALVLQTDFGMKDGAVSAMKGVAYQVDPRLMIFDLTHEITPYNIWEAAYRLYQTAEYWPENTVFVSVVDPGVGTKRNSVVVKTKNNQYVVTPDNGTLTLLVDRDGVEEVRLINEKINRLPGSELSYTFHGRDVYAYTGARLAAGKISFDEIGPKLPNVLLKIPYQKAIKENQHLKGNIPILDIQYGNVWTNISAVLFSQLKINKGQNVCFSIRENNQIRYQGKAPYQNSFGDVRIGDEVIYLNSLLNVSIALNRDNFANKYGIQAGPDWNIILSACN